ncbi:unnamed protein product [Moneuplotes crassus]|uniref:Glutamine cyclotransferase n=1 Tax=Euplotes crassus TaxID=5936 RepID=A0AAD2CYE7_EUPCR|nr:unnamed protein product [Moneuplotes crassus]
MNTWILLCLALLFSGVIGEAKASQDYNLLNTFRIPFPAFTQGFIYNNTNKWIIESTGLTGQSRIRVYTLNEDTQEASVAKRKFQNHNNEFGEGLTYLNGTYYQLTWMNKIIHLFDSNFKHLGSKPLPKEMKGSGWGITTDNHFLYATSGTDIIFKIDPETLLTVEEIKALDTDGSPLRGLNECQIVDKDLYCNKWGSTIIYKLNYKTGQCITKYEMKPLLDKVVETMRKEATEKGNSFRWSNYDHMNNVLNGIAFNPDKNTFYVTGKNWYYVFEVTFND